jgi:predicted nucleic acid-binding protein
MIIVDTAPLVAAAIENDSRHDECVNAFGRLHGERADLAVPCYVVNETCYLLAREGGNAASAAFMRSLGGQFRQIHTEPQDDARVADLLATYADLQLDLADASIIALAERHNVATLVTLDHRDFRTVRPAHVAAFTLLPADLSSPS